MFLVRCVAPGTLAALSDDAARGGRAGSSADAVPHSASATATAFIALVGCVRVLFGLLHTLAASYRVVSKGLGLMQLTLPCFLAGELV